MPSMFLDAPLTWDEAADLFAERLGIPIEEFRELEARYRGMAFSIARIAELRTLDRIQRRLTRAIELGEDLQTFRNWLTGQGEVWTRAYTELVFRMATLSSYSSARWEDMNDPDIVDEFLYLVYDAVDDDRTRDEHAAMDNRAWLRDQFPDEWVPPNGYNCRCGVHTLNEDLLRRSGADLQGNPPAETPDDGFQSNQAVDAPETLRRELEAIRERFSGGAV